MMIPALDYVLYENMEKKGEQKGGGCLGVMAILILPFAIAVVCCELGRLV